MKCHPSPIPPFPDCPHGHYLTPARTQMQNRHGWHTDAPWIAFLWIITVFWMGRGDVILSVVATVIYGLWFAIWYGSNICNNLLARKMLRYGVAYDDVESPNWEKRTKRNEPWGRTSS